MRSAILLACALCCISLASAQTRINVTMEVDSVPREFIIAKPSAQPPATGYPLVFMFHGTSGDGLKFYNISGWKEVGEAEGFLTVFPSSLEYRFYGDSGFAIRTSKWKNAEAIEALAPGQYMKDDAKFVRTMIDTLATAFHIDRSRIYAAGFSNGGCFVSKLAVDMSDVFAAIAPASGFLFPGDSTAPKRNIPIALSIGSMDENFTSRLGREVPLNDTGLAVFGSFVRRYCGVFGLAENYSETSTPLSITWLYKTASPGNNATEFSLSLIDDLPHQYPNGINYPLVAAQVVWNFFKRNPFPLTSIASPPAPQRLTVFPNPASEYLMLEGRGEATFTLYTLLGQRVFTTRTQRGQAIPLPQLAPGMYRAEAVSGGQAEMTMVNIR